MVYKVLIPIIRPGYLVLIASWGWTIVMRGLGAAGGCFGRGRVFWSREGGNVSSGEKMLVVFCASALQGRNRPPES